MAEDTAASPKNTEHAVEIVVAYVGHNSVPVTDLPNLLRLVHDILATLGKPEPIEVQTAPPKPAVPVRKSVTDEFIISLEDGRKLKSIKRYLAGLGMTPAEYRAKWNLPADYPMVAPAYTKQRSELARALGLGRKGMRLSADPVSKSESEATPQSGAKTPPAPKRGRKKAA